jgi:hypothetical protein
MSKTIELVAEAVRAVCDRDGDLGPLAEKVRVLAIQARDEHDRLKAAAADLRAVVEEALATGEHVEGCPATRLGRATEDDERRCTCWRQRAKARW